jgi:hypothetical protein
MLKSKRAKAENAEIQWGDETGVRKTVNTVIFNLSKRKNTNKNEYVKTIFHQYDLYGKHSMESTVYDLFRKYEFRKAHPVFKSIDKE